MKQNFVRHAVVVAGVIVLTILPQLLFACGSCYGDPHSSQTQGMNAAIMSMLGITATLFLAMSTLFFIVRRKVRMLQMEESKK